MHEGGWTIDPATYEFIRPDGTRLDRSPSQRSRGSADHTTSTSFDRPAPLAEATAERYDLELTIFGLVHNEERNRTRTEHARHTQDWHLAGYYGPPLPWDIERRRIVAASHERTSKLNRELATGW